MNLDEIQKLACEIAVSDILIPDKANSLFIGEQVVAEAIVYGKYSPFLMEMREATFTMLKKKIPSLQKTGKRWKGLCPFHKELTPSFFISPQKGEWFCFGTCNRGGKILELTRC